MPEMRLTRQQLYDLVWSEPMQKLARRFHLSDVGFAKACRRHGIPRPERGYWARVAVGTAPNKPRLSGDPDEQITFSIPDGPALDGQVSSPEVSEWIEREGDPSRKVVVPEVVDRLHPLVQLTLDKHDQPGYDSNALSITVGEESLSRALRLWHALVTAVESRGFTVGPKDSSGHTVIDVLGDCVTLTMGERRSKVQRLMPTPRHRWRRTPTGKLFFKIADGRERIIVKDWAKRPLEDQLNDVIVALVRIALQVVRPRRIAIEKEVARRAEEERLRRIFIERRGRFEAAFKAWQEHAERIVFVEQLERAADAVEAPGEAVRGLRGMDPTIPRCVLTDLRAVRIADDEGARAIPSFRKRPA